MNEMVHIDGRSGEGGGQIVRSALALSIATGTPFSIEQIRGGRSKPGLLRQHLTAVKAAIEISGAKAEGASLRSQYLTFTPGPVRAGNYHFAIGSAGSTTLVLQTLVPALLGADGPSSVTIEGGTHNPWAPPFEFVQKSYAPMIERLGGRLEVALERHGFYPAGGGILHATITPPPGPWQQLSITDRGDVLAHNATAITANLPNKIAHRELQVIGSRLNWPRTDLTAKHLTDTSGRGNVILATLTCQHIQTVFASFGQKGTPAEVVANSLSDSVRRYLADDVPIDAHLADQLIILIALCGGGRFCTQRLTNHSRTQISLIPQFLPVTISLHPHTNDTIDVTISS